MILRAFVAAVSGVKSGLSLWSISVMNGLARFFAWFRSATQFVKG